MELSLFPIGDHDWKISVPNDLIYGKQIKNFIFAVYIFVIFLIQDPNFRLLAAGSI